MSLLKLKTQPQLQTQTSKSHLPGLFLTSTRILKRIGILASSALSLLAAALLLYSFGVSQSEAGNKNKVNIKTTGNYLVITSNGIPSHKYSRIRVQEDTLDVMVQKYEFKVPRSPKENSATKDVGNNIFAVATNGVPIQTANAPWQYSRDKKYRYEALSGATHLGVMDEHNGHLHPEDGAYHYHGLPNGLVKELGANRAMVMIGYAADGFPVYNNYGFKDYKKGKGRFVEVKSSYKLRIGERSKGEPHSGKYVEDYEFVEGLGDLDECNGRFGVTKEYPEGIYHYYLTAKFPFVPRCWKGTPNDSFFLTWKK